MALGYRLSPNEEQLLLKQESERRRKLRLIQVRAQSKVNAANSRNAVKAEKKRQIEILACQVKEELEKTRLQKLAQASDTYNDHAKNFGSAHRDAHAERTDIKHERMRQAAINNKMIAAERHRLALQVMKDEKTKKFNEENNGNRLRQLAMDIEKVRANHISSLPAPKPDGVDCLDLSNFKTMKPVKCTDIKAFTNTHYHIAGDSGFAEKADNYEYEQTADQEAIIANEHHNEQSKLISLSVHERNAKSQLRFKHAIRKENVKNDYNNLLHDLSNLQREDKHRRQQIISTIPKQIFEAPFRRIETKKHKQNAIENAFEKMFIKKDDYDENDIPPICRPVAPPATTTASAEAMTSNPSSNGGVVVETVVKVLDDSALDVTLLSEEGEGQGEGEEPELDTAGQMLQRIPDGFQQLLQGINNNRKQLLNVNQESEDEAIELNTCLAKNEELSSALSELTTSYQNTCEELDEISRNYKDMVLEKDDLRARLDTSLDDASKCKANSNSMMKEMEGAHKQMDDIMYTLSLQGYTSVRDSTGNTIELKHLSGDSHFENEDCISESEYKQNIQEKDEKIAKLKAKCKLLEDNNSNLPAEENGNTINDLTDTVNNLRDQLLQIKISEINITDELEKEKKEKDELLKSHEQYKVVLCDRISNLKLALNSSKESKSCKPIEDRAARKLRHANARRQRRRECVTSTENNTGVECQGDQPTITETNDKLEGQEVDFENNRLDV